MARSLVLLLLLARSVASQTRAIVYTTAESTSFRLTPTDTLVFKPSEPTSEAKVYVFVDPRKTFQPFLGIGGALTRVDPLTYGVDGVRGLLIGRTHFGVALDVAVLVGVGVLFVLFGAWRFSKIEA